MHYLREKDSQRREFESPVIQRLETTPVEFGSVASGVAQTAHVSCDCGLCDGTEPICKGAGPLCKLCKESLSWNKGKWRITPFGFLTGDIFLNEIPDSFNFGRLLLIGLAGQTVSFGRFTLVKVKISMIN